MRITVLFKMIYYELVLLLRSKWLLSFTILFMLLAGLLYFYGIQSLQSNPSEVAYGLESGTSINTSGKDPSLFGVEAIEKTTSKEDLQAGYNRAIAMLMNLALWILPIICLILGVTSIVADKESGRLTLYKTYNTPFTYYVVSKFAALTLSLSIALGLSYGLAGLVLALLGHSFSASIYIVFIALHFLLIIVFTGAALMIGSISTTRMQGLSFSFFFWSFVLFVYEFLIFSVIDLFPYAYKLKGLLTLILLNPIESIRVWSINHLHAGYIFGPEYLILQEGNNSSLLTLYVVISILIILGINIFLSNQIMKRKG
ncbi:ABC transporter permease subunit [Ferdinandcohnia quinoae]|uniref:ABC transporter permease subunit n=1 Tax=Fredinandcohnia quinoae TaxID=2918902 RepID=A0AAW5E5Z8_9BACI|nr:ABC transporter permease subunit [Fredinandcohnia sp. SECRCQ15]MCH1625401.1 ABC transporter permease subunit [Fredinandcohnia sp. SECRCQ15]